MTALRAEAPRRERGERETRRKPCAKRTCAKRCGRRKRKLPAYRRDLRRVACARALEAETPAKQDNDLLKGLPKMKVAATWTPWTYANLSSRSGYGAGVTSPAWYEHLWRSGKGDRAIGWLTHAARLFREQDMDCSSAHIIEASRLATSLAALRERPRPGLPELFTKRCKPRSAWATPRRCASSSVSLSWATNWGRFPKPRPPSRSSGIWNSSRKACA